MHKELDKYKTGQKISVNAILHRLDGSKEERIVQVDEYKFKFGDLITDYIIHINQNWLWKFYYGKWKYNDLTRIYKQWLNLWGVCSDSGL